MNSKASLQGVLPIKLNTNPSNAFNIFFSDNFFCMNNSVTGSQYGYNLHKMYYRIFH